MFTHVLIPLDGSVQAEKATRVAPNILPPQCKITLLMVIAESGENGDPEAVQQARDYLEHTATWLKLKTYEVKTDIKTGDPADAIVNFAQHSNIDAIMMCTHGRSGLERVLFGSVTLKVLNMTPCPVIVIPDREQQRVADEATADEDVAPFTPGLVQ
jgi:nucleotide-binding universal stress UspA family protein